MTQYYFLVRSPIDFIYQLAWEMIETGVRVTFHEISECIFLCRSCNMGPDESVFDELAEKVINLLIQTTSATTAEICKDQNQKEEEAIYLDRVLDILMEEGLQVTWH